MKLKDFEKFRKEAPMLEREGQPPPASHNSRSLFSIGYGISAERLLEMFPLEDRPTVEEAQRLRDEFAKNFPTLEEKLRELRGRGR